MKYTLKDHFHHQTPEVVVLNVYRTGAAAKRAPVAIGGGAPCPMIRRNRFFASQLHFVFYLTQKFYWPHWSYCK